MLYPTSGSGGQSSYGIGDNVSLEERKKALLQKMLGNRNSGLQGTRALPLYGGRGRNASDLESAGLPGITFNPFLAQIAGRPQEDFSSNMPGDISSLAAAIAQNGPGPVAGGGPQGAPDNTQQAAATALGQIGPPSLNPGPATGAQAAPVTAMGSGGGTQLMQTSDGGWRSVFQAPSASAGVRHLTGDNPLVKAYSRILAR